MSEIIYFVQHATPMILLGLALVIIVIILLENTDGLLSLFKRKEGKIQKPTLQSVTNQLNVIAGNHLHELPEMKRILDKISEEQILQGQRLSSVEMAIKIILKV